VEEIIYQAIQLQEPLVKRTKKEQELYDAKESTNMDDDAEVDE
jgi:hypothetical protein